jgi:hypothetical protein
MTDETCKALGYITVGGRNVGLVRCARPAGHAVERGPGYPMDSGRWATRTLPGTPHLVTLSWSDDSPSLPADDWPEAEDPDETFDVEVELDESPRQAWLDEHGPAEWPGGERPDEAAKTAARSTRPGSRCPERRQDGERCIATVGHDFGHVSLSGARWGGIAEEPPGHLFGR